MGERTRLASCLVGGFAKGGWGGKGGCYKIGAREAMRVVKMAMVVVVAWLGLGLVGGGGRRSERSWL